ncbi:MAG: hypothetical protein Q8R39_04025 [bacterium]|nr:hypothetical protein [bacterium]MDZ4285248.1 hypothetical protein [Patescibacteria group bacterium]
MPSLNPDFIFYHLYAVLSDPSLLSPVNLLRAIAPYSIGLSLILATLITYSIIRITQMRTEEREILRVHHEEVHRARAGAVRNEKWQRVLAHIASPNQSDWRLAILEADIMLEEMMSGLGYHGETLADKLKSVEKSDFLTIESAWEAHRIRNEIAHAGGDFLLSEREAKRAIDLYRQVFDEFRCI